MTTINFIWTDFVDVDIDHYSIIGNGSEKVSAIPVGSQAAQYSTPTTLQGPWDFELHAVAINGTYQVSNTWHYDFPDGVVDGAPQDFSGSVV